MDLSRKARDFDIVLATATSGATTLDLRDVNNGILALATVSTNAGTTLQMWVSNAPAGTYCRLYKADGNAVDLTIAPSSTEGKAYSLPVEIAGAEYLKVISPDTHSTGVTGSVMLKS
jgi:hypothetical protein